MKVFVLSKQHKPLMPTTPRRARLWLKAKRARVVCREPFTIQLRFETTAYAQPVTVGVDMGSQTVGVAAKSRGEVAYQAEVSLRTAIASKLTQRRAYRRNRRSRKNSVPSCAICESAQTCWLAAPFLTLQGRSYGQDGWLRCLNLACHPGACRSGQFRYTETAAPRTVRGSLSAGGTARILDPRVSPCEVEEAVRLLWREQYPVASRAYHSSCQGRKQPGEQFNAGVRTL